MSPTGPAFTLSGSIEPTRPSMAYRAGLVVVALAMLLLPVIYVSIVRLYVDLLGRLAALALEAENAPTPT